MNNPRLNTKLLTSLVSVLFMPAAEIRKASSIASTTWYAIMQKPNNITIKQLLAIANGLCIPVHRFFSTDSADLILKREDYIVTPYKPCYYNTDMLQDIITNRADATWQKAAHATGVTRDNLRRSMLAVRRTPVTRFLDVCRALSIDPFCILIDPNPILEHGKHKRSASRSTDGEIAELRQQIANLNATVNHLKEQYEALLVAHEQLARRVNVNIENINSSYINNIGIAADERD